jgi:hypothetical protein
MDAGMAQEHVMLASKSEVRLFERRRQLLPAAHCSVSEALAPLIEGQASLRP